MNLQNNIALSYDDICLLPRFSQLETRSEADTSQTMGLTKYKAPVIPANMKCVVNTQIAEMLYNNGYFYVMDRFGDTYNFVKYANKNKWDTISISVGVKKEDYDLILKLREQGFRVTHITVDVAHGHHELVKNMVEFIYNEFPTYIIGGNVCTFTGFFDLARWGCDCVKVGVGPGCFTAGNQVMTQTGLKNIEDINVGEFVLTHKNRFKEVLNTYNFDSGDFDMYNINGIICTHNHEFLVIHNKDICNVTEFNYLDYAVWLPAYQITADYSLVEL
jgi:hypothetical protein